MRPENVVAAYWIVVFTLAWRAFLRARYRKAGRIARRKEAA